MNRILAAIDRSKAQIEESIDRGQVSKAEIASLKKTLDMDLMEYFRFQEAKSLAVCNGKLTTDEGQTVYAILGNSLEHFNEQPVERKIVMTQLFQVLLSS